MYTMLNTSEFAKRLEIILEEYELSAAGFAQKIEVGRASISHIISGRNKPSLDFILKIVTTFPEVDLYWLLNGKGSFPKSITTPLPEPVSSTLFSKTEKETPKEVTVTPISQTPIVEEKTIDKEIDKIVFFYTDGSFKAYHP